MTATARQVAQQISKWVDVSAHCGCGDTSRGCAEYSYTIDVPAAEVAIQQALDAAVRAERERIIEKAIEWIRAHDDDCYTDDDIAQALRAPEASA